MDNFYSDAGLPPPFGMSPLDRLAYQQLIWTAWRDAARWMAQEREAQLAFASDVAPEQPTADLEPSAPAPSPTMQIFNAGPPTND